MGNIQYAESMFLGFDKKAAGAKKDNLAVYKDYLKKGQYFQTSFEQIDVKGRLVQFDGNIKIIMESANINGRDCNPRYRAEKLKSLYCVKVNQINDKDNSVIVSQASAREEQKPVVQNELDKKLEQSNLPIHVKGRIVKIRTKNTGEDIGIWLDLCGVGIMGYVFIGDWNPTYTPSFQGLVQYGDIVDIVVREKKEYDNGFSYYVCSRKELIDNPWNETLNEKFHVGDIVKIKCKSLNGNHWFGEIKGLEKIQVFTEFPSSIHSFEIEVGKEYLGKIYHMDIDKHSLKARVFQIIQ